MLNTSLKDYDIKMKEKNDMINDLRNKLSNYERLM